MDRGHRIEIPTPFSVGRVNCYVFGGGPLIVLDPGPATDAAFESLRDGLDAIGYDISDIDTILITHPHMDHYGGASRIVEQSGAAVYAHPDAVRVLEDPDGYFDLEQEFFAPFLLSMGVPEQIVDTVVTLPEPYSDFHESVDVDETLADGDVAPIGDSYEAVSTPGHSPGSLCYLSRSESAAFTGDHVMAHISPNPLLTLAPGSDSERTRSLPTYLESLERLRTFDIETGYAGHGETIQTLDERIGEILAHHQDRKQNIESIIRAQGPVSAYAIMQELFPDLPATEMFPGMSEVIGHLDLLENEGKVTLSHNGDDVWLYGSAA